MCRTANAPPGVPHPRAQVEVARPCVPEWRGEISQPCHPFTGFVIQVGSNVNIHMARHCCCESLTGHPRLLGFGFGMPPRDCAGDFSIVAHAIVVANCIILAWRANCQK